METFSLRIFISNIQISFNLSQVFKLTKFYSLHKNIHGGDSFEDAEYQGPVRRILEFCRTQTL